MESPESVKMSKLTQLSEGVLKQASLFGYILWSKISKKRFLCGKRKNYSHGILAKRMRRSNLDLLSASKLLHVDTESATKTLEKVFAGR
jgi:hypothetical protein